MNIVYTEEKCPACNGNKIQKRTDGISILCPACQGSGEVYIPSYKPLYVYPGYPLYPPFVWYSIDGGTQNVKS